MLGGSQDYPQRQPDDDQSNRPVKRPRSGTTANVYPSDAVFIGTSENYPAVSEKPPNGRQDIATTPRTQEKDKNRRLSCKECRRLKLKCDRVFPCQSCVKRGCGSLCPEGALTSGRGSRFILANTEQLHEKITQLSDRVRELEDALQSLQATCTTQPHPLLSAELLQVKTSQDLYSTPQTANQPIAGPSTPDKVDIFIGNTQPVPLPDHQVARELAPPQVPPDILQLSATFPFPWAVDLRIRARIRGSLPPLQEAQAICEEAQRNALWQYHLDASETFLQNLLHHCYSTSIEDLSPRRLALLLMLLSIGSIVDLRKPAGSLYGEAYHHLARASVCEIPLMEEPDFDVLHALFFMIWWHLIFSDNKKAVGYAWNLMGFVAKLAQGLGLHRDNPRLKGIPEEYEKRRAIFWELLNLDCRMSLSLGRPPSICLAHVDTKPPSYLGVGLHISKEEIIYHEWKHAFFVRCLSPVLEAMVVADAPNYSRILELDNIVRDFAVPAMLDGKYAHDANPRFLVMQRGLVSSSREIVLLQLHRRFFTEAMNSAEAFDAQHKYAPSVLATYLGAASLISTVEMLFDCEPELSARFLYIWFNSYSAAVTLSLFVFRAPYTSFAANAAKEIERVGRLFRRATEVMPASGRILPLMDKLTSKTRSCLRQYCASPNREEIRSNTQSSEAPLPASFKDVHPSLVRYAEEIKCTPSHCSDLPPSPVASYHPRQTESSSAITDRRGGTWLPDIYRYASAGVGVEDRYRRPSPQPTPFTPSSPRCDDKEEFNLDHGALTNQFGETSFMAWF